MEAWILIALGGVAVAGIAGFVILNGRFDELKGFKASLQQLQTVLGDPNPAIKDLQTQMLFTQAFLEVNDRVGSQAATVSAFAGLVLGLTGGFAGDWVLHDEGPTGDWAARGILVLFIALGSAALIGWCGMRYAKRRNSSEKVAAAVHRKQKDLRKVVEGMAAQLDELRASP